MSKPVGRDVFDAQTARYDAWYETPVGRAAFAEEIAALRPLLAELPTPWLEVGVGTGRAAAALGARFGIDPAAGAVHLAAGRVIHVAVARGETLPFRDGTFGAVLFVLALCFIQNPLTALREARRVLRPNGAVLLGLLLAEGAWANHYRALAAGGHAYYRRATFFDREELNQLLAAAGLRVARVRSALFWGPNGEPPGVGGVQEGDAPTASFRAILAVPAS